MGSFESTFGPSYGDRPGFVAFAGQSQYSHRFGGDSWKVVDRNPVADGPALLMVLDLHDPRLAEFGGFGLSELPIATYLNADVWAGEQAFSIDPEKHQLEFYAPIAKEEFVQPIESRLPNPLPHRQLSLRPMNIDEYPLDEGRYWRNCDDFLGGPSFLRVGGKPLWLQESESVECACGSEPTFVLGVGYENLSSPSALLDQGHLFFGEGALYFFYCTQCKLLHSRFQSS